MNPEQPRRAATVPLPVPQSHQNPPPAPPLPPQQRARNALNRFLGFPARAADADGEGRDGSGTGLKDVQRLPSLSAYNASASHKTGLEINSLSINDEGSHAILAGRDILKTIRVDEGSCTEDINIRAAIRNYSAHTSGRSKDNINISDVAWGKGNFGNYIAAANANGPITLYDLNHPGIEVAQLKEHRRQIHRVTFNPHAGQHFLSASQDGTVRLWDLRDVRRDANTFPSRFTTSGQNEGVRDVKWSPTDIFELAMCTDGGFVQRWDTRKLKSPLTRIAAHTGPCATIDWHPDGKHLLSASSDKTVKVWNISAEGRRHKAVYEIKTPYPLRHARWRPSCQSSWPTGRGSRQCTQIVTSYERDHPTVHVWDFRRPWLPFREMEGYQTAPTDLLWHSQDLLWTVNREGMFLQHDIKYAKKVMDKRNMQAFAISPLGEFSLATQKRATRLRPGLNRGDSEAFIRHRRNGLSPSETIAHTSSRGSHDDTIDDTFLSSSYGKRHARSPSAKLGKSSNESPPTYDMNSTRTVSLEDVLKAGRAYKPGQSAARGRLPGSPNLLLIQYFAKQYTTRVLPEPPSVDAFMRVHEVFERNATHAQKASLYRLAQSWRMMGQAVMTELLTRANLHRGLRVKNETGPRKSLLDESPFARRTRRWLGSTERRLSSKPGTPLSRPLRTVKSRSTVQPDSTSNVPTPIARPVKDRPGLERAPLKEIDTDESLTLPPSLLTPSEIKQNIEEQSRATLQAVDHRGIEHRNSWYGSVQNYQDKREAISNWRQPLKQPLNLEDESNERPKPTRYNSDESFGMFPSLSSRDASGPASSVASRSDLMEAVQENLRSEGSYGSMNLGSSSSSEPILSQSYQARQDIPEDQSQGSVAVSSSESDHEGAMVVPAPKENKDAPARDIPRDMQTLALNNQQSFTSEIDAFPSQRNPPEDVDNMEASGTIIPHRHSRQLGRSREGSVTKPTALTHGSGSAPAVMPSKNASVDSTKTPFITADFLASDYNIDAEKNKPFRVINMLNHLLDYHTMKVPDAQAATNFIFMLTPLLPETHALPQASIDATIAVYSEYFTAMGYSDMEIYSLFSTSFEHLIKAGLQPLQAESIISTYHSQLQHLGLFSNAAYLRRVSYPMYPSVYEGGLKDTQVSFMCGTCRKPINTPNKMRCENCTQRQDPCPICWCDTSPFEAPAKIKTRAGGNRTSAVEPFVRPATAGDDDDETQQDDTEAAQLQKNALYSTCLLCNHSAHAACLRTWHSQPPSHIDVSPTSVSTSEGACPTPGCFCACTPGPRRNELLDTVERREREKSVREDDWVVAESRAARTAATLAGGRNKSGVGATTPNEEVGSGRRERRSVGFRKG